MWNKQLKETAILLANCNDTSLKESIIQKQQLTLNQLTAFKLAYAVPAAVDRTRNAPLNYWD